MDGALRRLLRGPGPPCAVGPQDRQGQDRQGQPLPEGRARPDGHGAAKTDTFLGERYRRLAKRMPKAKALAAIERSILVVIFHLLADPAATFDDLGSDYYAKRLDTARRTRNLVGQLEALGHRVTLAPAARGHRRTADLLRPTPAPPDPTQVGAGAPSGARPTPQDPPTAVRPSRSLQGCNSRSAKGSTDPTASPTRPSFPRDSLAVVFECARQLGDLLAQSCGVSAVLVHELGQSVEGGPQPPPVIQSPEGCHRCFHQGPALAAVTAVPQDHPEVEASAGCSPLVVQFLEPLQALLQSRFPMVLASGHQPRHPQVEEGERRTPLVFRRPKALDRLRRDHHGFPSPMP